MAFCAGRAGVQILSAAQVRSAKLLVVADVNAVPPLGVEGLDVHADGAKLGDGKTLGIGALAIGQTKYGTEIGLFQRMIQAGKPVRYDFRDAFVLARELAANGARCAPAVLIAAQSGRALAAAARRAGYAPLVADLFEDDDTRALASRTARLPGSSGARRIARRCCGRSTGSARAAVPSGLVYGTGFETRPDLLDAARRAISRCSATAAETVRRVKDPQAFAALCRDCAVPHPEVAMRAGRRVSGWRSARAAAAALTCARPGPDGCARRATCSAGRRATRSPPCSSRTGADARSCSASARNGRRPRRASPTDMAARRGRRRSTPRSLPRSEAAVRRLAAAAGLVGLNAADCLVRADGFDVLEINPRPGASLDVFADPDGLLFQWHVEACRDG